MTLHDCATRFSTQDACIDAIIARRWPDGWSCPACHGTRHYRLRARRVLRCANPECRTQTSVTRGTVFAQAKISLPKFFLAISLMTDKHGISAMSLAKHLDVAYTTAFDLLHQLQHAMVNRDRACTLRGVLQVDEGYVGGHGDGKHRSGRATDTKRRIGVMAAQRGSTVTGNIHIEVPPAANAETLHGMIWEKVASGSRILTDDWAGYRGRERKGCAHDPVKSRSGRDACDQWPLVHRAISNFTAWLMGTHRNFCLQRLGAYAAEYCWRANRRNRTKDEYCSNLREPFMADRLLTLACRHGHRTPAEVRAERWAA